MYLLVLKDKVYAEAMSIDELKSDMDNAVSEGTSPDDFMVYQKVKKFTYTLPSSRLVID